ncbi:MAG: hypothetical protein WAX04_08145, partial [Oscillospiraceae bacterium]
RKTSQSVSGHSAAVFTSLRLASDKISGSFHLKSTNASHLTISELYDIFTGCWNISQGDKIQILLL